MEIKDANNNVILSETYDSDHPERYFVVADSSYRYQEIMGDINEMPKTENTEQLKD